MRAVLLVLAITTALSPLRAAAPGGCAGDSLQPLTIALSAERIEISGGTPNGKVLLVGYGNDWDPAGYVLQFRRFQAYLSTDANGVFSVARGGAADSIWAAIDVESGRCGTTAADPSKHRQEPIRREALKLRNGKLKNLDVDLSLAYMVMVRPRVGAWELTAGDGSAVDDDDDGTRKPNGKTSLSLDRMEGIGASGPVPEELETGDVLLVFSPHRSSFAFARVEKSR